MTTTVDVGVRILQEELRGHGFELVQRQKLFDRRASYLVIQHRDSKQQIDFVLTDEYLSDLEKTPGYLPSLKSHLAAFTFRIQNISWNSFYCTSGRALNIEIQWPSEVMPQRAASFMWVNAAAQIASKEEFISRLKAAEAVSRIVTDTEFMNCIVANHRDGAIAETLVSFVPNVIQ